MRTGKIRVITTKQSKIARERHDLIKNAIGQANKAAYDGYFLEAITLVESLIVDRLESKLQFYDKSESGFGNFGRIAEKLRKFREHIEPQYFALMDEEIIKWIARRNTALHEMSKLGKNSMLTFEARYSECKDIYLEGERLRKRLFALDKKGRNQGPKSRNANDAPMS